MTIASNRLVRASLFKGPGYSLRRLLFFQYEHAAALLKYCKRSFNIFKRNLYVARFHLHRVLEA